MREGGWAFLSRLVPRRTATVYFILFGSTLLLSITILNGSERLFREFTSCQGSFEFSINTFTALVVIQCLLLLPKLKEPFVEDGESSETHSAEGHRRLDNSGNLLPPEKLSSRIDSPSRRLFSNDGFINLLGDKFSAKPYSEMTSRVSSLGRDSVDSVSIHVKLDSDDELLKGRDKQRKRSRKSLRAKKDDVASAVASQLLASDGDAPLDESTPEEAKGCIRASSWMSNVTICWNSLWMLLYHLVSFMGIHATLLASRIHGSIELNKYALDTCSHLRDKFPLGMWSPKVGYPLISESAFFLTYMSCTSFELITRKSADASYLKNFFSRHYLKELTWLGVVRIVLQVVIFLYAITLGILSVWLGYGSPMHILCGFSIGMLMLWINALLTQLLQLSHMLTSTLNFNWVWSLLSLLTFWICGVLFYVSVYGLPLMAPYMYMQAASWIPLLILTCRKGEQIFMWENISTALYAFK